MGACWGAGSAEDGGKGWRKVLVWGEQETGPKEGRGKTKQPKSTNRCHSSAFGGHWCGREHPGLPLRLALHILITFTGEARKEGNVLPVPQSTQFKAKRGHRVLCFPN